MAQMLELSGYEVAVACDGIDGVERALSWHPDLILMDLRMPRMDGFEAIKELRKDPATADIPIIAISAWASAKHKERAIEAGANEHFTKPVDLSRLLETINRFLSQQATR
jgi:CheY-like chemotaxis protein